MVLTCSRPLGVGWRLLVEWKPPCSLALAACRLSRFCSPLNSCYCRRLFGRPWESIGLTTNSATVFPQGYGLRDHPHSGLGGTVRLRTPRAGMGYCILLTHGRRADIGRSAAGRAGLRFTQRREVCQTNQRRGLTSPAGLPTRCGRLRHGPSGGRYALRRGRAAPAANWPAETRSGSCRRRPGWRRGT